MYLSVFSFVHSFFGWGYDTQPVRFGICLILPASTNPAGKTSLDQYELAVMQFSAGLVLVWLVDKHNHDAVYHQNSLVKSVLLIKLVKKHGGNAKYNICWSF